MSPQPLARQEGVGKEKCQETFTFLCMRTIFAASAVHCNDVHFIDVCPSRARVSTASRWALHIASWCEHCDTGLGLPVSGMCPAEARALPAHARRGLKARKSTSTKSANCRLQCSHCQACTRSSPSCTSASAADIAAAVQVPPDLPVPPRSRISGSSLVARPSLLNSRSDSWLCHPSVRAAKPRSPLGPHGSVTVSAGCRCQPTQKKNKGQRQGLPRISEGECRQRGRWPIRGGGGQSVGMADRLKGSPDTGRLTANATSGDAPPSQTHIWALYILLL